MMCEGSVANKGTNALPLLKSYLSLFVSYYVNAKSNSFSYIVSIFAGIYISHLATQMQRDEQAPSGVTALDGEFLMASASSAIS